MGVAMTWTIIVGLVLGLAMAALVVLQYHRLRDLYAVFLVLGVVALALAVTIIRVDDYRSSRAQANASSTAAGESVLPGRPPLASGGRGAAAPAPSRNS